MEPPIMYDRRTLDCCGMYIEYLSGHFLLYIILEEMDFLIIFVIDELLL